MEYVSYIVELDQCQFLSGSNIKEDESFHYPGTLYLDNYLNLKGGDNNTIDLVSIKVVHRINGEEYVFVSPPCSNSIDDLRIRIEFFKSIVVNYNKANPREYFFEFKES